MYKITIYISIVLLTMVGCTRDNYLDFIPKGTSIPSTLKEYRLMLDQVSTNFTLSAGFGRMHLRSFFYTDDVLLTEAIASERQYRAEYNRAYRFDENHFTISEDDVAWTTYYNQIYTANIILDGLSKLEGEDPEDVAELESEARMHRAFAYFNLVNLYGLHYNPSTAATDMGVPIREGIELSDVDLTRASVEEVYAYVLNDITTSIDHLADTQVRDLRFRPSKAGAYSLLARLYLYQARYQEALDAAEDALALFSDMNDYNTYEVSAASDVLVLPNNPLDNEEIIWYKAYEFIEADALFVSDDLVDKYEVGDLRQKWFSSFTVIEPDNDLGIVNNTYWTSVNHNTGFGTAELLLTSAECNTRLNNNGAALMRLNQLRQNRWLTDSYQAVDIANNDALLDYIKDERRREMVINRTRMFDIKRYNRHDNSRITVTHNYDGVDYTLQPNGLNWAFPIALRYIQFNPEIQQNPRD